MVRCNPSSFAFTQPIRYHLYKKRKLNIPLNNNNNSSYINKINKKFDSSPFVRIKNKPTTTIPTANNSFQLSRNALILRFSNENSYLNWARNGVLSSAVGVAMYAQEHHRGAQLSGAGLLLLGFGYIGVGTIKYIYYIIRFRKVMELSLLSVCGTITHASGALLIWLMASACFLESVPLELDYILLAEPVASWLPLRIRQGLIETYSLYLDDLEYHNDEEERVLNALRAEKEKKNNN